MCAYVLAGGEWSEEAVQELEQLTLCGTWKVVMVKVCDYEGETPAIKIVDTTTDKVRWSVSLTLCASLNCNLLSHPRILKWQSSWCYSGTPSGSDRFLSPFSGRDQPKMWVWLVASPIGSL